MDINMLLEQLDSKRERMVQQLGETEYAKQLGMYAARLINSGLLCKSFIHNQPYSSMDENNQLYYIDLKTKIEAADKKCAEIDKECIKIKQSNPIIAEYLDLQEQLRNLHGNVPDVETQNRIAEKKIKLEKQLQLILDDEQNKALISKYKDLRSEQDKIQFEISNQISRLLNQGLYIGSVLTNIQLQDMSAILESYTQGFFSILDLKEISESLNYGEASIQRHFADLFSDTQKDYSTELASYYIGSKKLIDESIYDSNKKYNAFYEKLAQSMSTRLKEKTKKEKTKKEETEEINVNCDISGIGKIKLSDIPKNKRFYHFTRESYIPGILKEGLRSDLESRENAVSGDYENPCVYFSEGEEGLLKTIDVWIRWEYNNITSEEKQPSGDVITIPNALDKTFRRISEDFKNRRYFLLDLVEGTDKETSDFFHGDEDFKKKRAIDRGGPSHKTKWMLGSYTDWSTPTLEDWNMMTHIRSRPIFKDRMTLITDNQGRSDAISIIQEIYKRNNDKNFDTIYLDVFIKYLQELSKEMAKSKCQSIGKDSEFELDQVAESEKIMSFLHREAINLDSIDKDK